VWSIGSANGRWHPSPDLNIEVFQERSTAVYEMIELRAEVIDAVEPLDLPTFTSLNTWFRVSYPDSGFVDAPLDWTPVTHLGAVDPSDPDTLPDRFVVIVDSPGRAGDDEAAFVAAVDDSGAFRVTAEEFRVGRFTSETRIYTRS